MNKKLSASIDANTTHTIRKVQKIREREEALARVRNQQITKKQRASNKIQQKVQVLPLPSQSSHLSTVHIAPPALRTRIKFRHRLIFISFLMWVMVPNLIAAWYLWERAANRYISVAGFSVHTESISSAVEMLGGIAKLSGSGSSDEDILQKFIQSTEIVQKIDASIDLRHIWSKGDPDKDPIFNYRPPGTIEDLTSFWNRMVTVYKDSSTGLIDLEVQAFSPTDARAIALAIYHESSILINRLSDIARDDTTRSTMEELRSAAKRLNEARAAVFKFRNKNQIIFPESTIQIQSGVLMSLETELADVLIEIDMLKQITSAKDPRHKQAARRRAIIEKRLIQERLKFGIGNMAGANQNVFAEVVGEYENLSVGLQFAEQSYALALAAYDSAVSESRRQTRYLATHINPTLPEASMLPNRPLMLAFTFIFSMVTWSIMATLGYSIRDRN